MSCKANRLLPGLALMALFLTGCGEVSEEDTKESDSEAVDAAGAPQPSLDQRISKHIQEFRDDYQDKYRAESPPKNMGKRLSPEETLPDPNREFRATWVATVHNLDWPSKPGLPTD